MQTDSQRSREIQRQTRKEAKTEIAIERQRETKKRI